MWYIKLTLNEKGRQVCGLCKKTIEYDGVERPDGDKIREVVASKFMCELVDTVDEVIKDYKDLKRGDPVKIVEPTKDGGESVSYGEVVCRFDQAPYGELRVQTRDLENYSETCYSSELRFGFDGCEIGGSRKFKRRIERLDKGELEYYEAGRMKSSIYKEVDELLHFCNDWEDPDDGRIPPFVTVQVLLGMRELLLESKKKYDGPAD